MKNLKCVLLVILIISSLMGYSQEQQLSTFKTNLNKTDIKAVLKAVADWQVRTPLTHHLADWTNGALYSDMVEWAGIAGDESYYEWIKGISEKLSWTYYIHDNPFRRYHADDYCVGQTYIELYRKYKDKKMIKPMRAYLDQILKDPAKGDLLFVNTKEYWSTQRWSWCDALFMGPTVWAKMAEPAGYQKIIDYWAGKGPKPTVEEAKATFIELAENVKIENCKINYLVLNALLPVARCLLLFF